MIAPAASATDIELTARVADGDRGAFANLYDRYSGPLFDFAARTTRDRDIAADVVQNTFVKAWGSLQDRSPPQHPKAWLYAIARNDATDELRRRGRAGAPPPTEPDAAQYIAIEHSPADDPQRAVEDRELAALVWAAAGALSPTEYALLDMHVRQGLTLDEIAWTLGVSTQNVYKKMSRLRTALEEAVGDELLRKTGGDCPELDQLVARLGTDELTPTGRRAISKHVRSCDECQEERERLVSPAALFSRLAPVPLTAAASERIFGNAQSNLDDAPRAQVPPGPMGRARNWWWLATTRSRLLVIGAAAAIVVAVIVALMLLSGGSTDELADPGDARSSTHTVGEPSQSPSITIEWTPLTGIDGYSITWDHEPETLPDQTVDLAETAGSTTSDDLPEGDWFFHLRTNADGEWTSTVHLGPFLVRAPEPPAETEIAPEETATPEDPPPPEPQPAVEDDASGVSVADLADGLLEESVIVPFEAATVYDAATFGPIEHVEDPVLASATGLLLVIDGYVWAVLDVDDPANASTLTYEVDRYSGQTQVAGADLVGVDTEPLPYFADPVPLPPLVGPALVPVGQIEDGITDGGVYVGQLRGATFLAQGGSIPIIDIPEASPGLVVLVDGFLAELNTDRATLIVQLTPVIISEPE